MKRSLQREKDGDEDDDGCNDNDNDDDYDIGNLNLPSTVFLLISKAIVAEQIPEKADSNEI